MNGNNRKKQNYLSEETRSLSSGVKKFKMENELINQPTFDKTFVEFCRKVERNKKFLLNLKLNTKQGKIIFVCFNYIIYVKSFAYSIKKQVIFLI